MNKITAVGRLTADPTITESANGAALCHFTVAANTRRKNAAGQPLTNFYRCTVWRTIAENCARYLHTGDMVTISGDLALTEYSDRNGQPRCSLEVDVSDVAFPPAPKAPPTVQAPADSDELPI